MRARVSCRMRLLCFHNWALILSSFQAGPRLTFHVFGWRANTRSGAPRHVSWFLQNLFSASIIRCSGCWCVRVNHNCARFPGFSRYMLEVDVRREVMYGQSLLYNTVSQDLGDAGPASGPAQAARLPMANTTWYGEASVWVCSRYMGIVNHGEAMTCHGCSCHVYVLKLAATIACHLAAALEILLGIIVIGKTVWQLCHATSSAFVLASSFHSA